MHMLTLMHICMLVLMHRRASRRRRACRRRAARRRARRRRDSRNRLVVRAQQRLERLLQRPPLLPATRPQLIVQEPRERLWDGPKNAQIELVSVRPLPATECM